MYNSAVYFAFVLQEPKNFAGFVAANQKGSRRAVNETVTFQNEKVPRYFKNLS